jgi:hypothetical protein
MQSMESWSCSRAPSLIYAPRLTPRAALLCCELHARSLLGGGLKDRVKAAVTWCSSRPQHCVCALAEPCCGGRWIGSNSAIVCAVGLVHAAFAGEGLRHPPRFGSPLKNCNIKRDPWIMKKGEIDIGKERHREESKGKRHCWIRTSGC